MREDENVNPEDYWSSAEQLLDNHFQAKKRRRYLLLLLLLISSSAGVVTYIYSGSNHLKSTDKRNVPVSKSASGSVSHSLQQSVISNGNPIVIQKDVTANDRNDLTSKNDHFEIAENRRQKLSNNEIAVESGVIERKEVSGNDNIESKLMNVGVEMMSLADLKGYPHLGFTDSDEIVVANNTKEEVKKTHKWDIFLYGGINKIDKEIAGSPVAYINRRNTEENKIHLPGAGVQFGKSYGDFDIRGGLELSIVGEKVNYSPYSKGEYYGSSQQWQQYQYSVTDTDSTYIFGMLFLNTQIVQRTDSVLKEVLDTLNGLHYNEEIAIRNGGNRKYILELPLTVTYQLSRSRFGIGVFAGVAPGVVLRSKGYYLVNDESAIADLSESKQQFTFNIQGGLEFAYLMNDHIRLVLRPAAKLYITGIAERNGGSSKYRSTGIQLGIVKNFR